MFDAAGSDLFYNDHNGGKNFNTAGKIPHNKGKPSKIRGETHPMFGKTGENNPNFGKIRTQDMRNKYSLSKLGENNPSFGKTGADSNRSKKYKIMFPDGHIEIVIGLLAFCREYNLQNTNMIKVAKGERKHHKGFKCEYYVEETDK